ncbi:MAG: hypothetical protein WC763_06110 [Candidatus Paceibacterota bacterium]
MDIHPASNKSDEFVGRHLEGEFDKNYVGIPISAAQRIADEFDKNQVIIVTWDAKHGKTHVTTYGRTKEECEQAAVGGNLVKRALGWPENLCNAKPVRTK